MASREEKFTATIEINSQQAQSRLNELKKEVDDLKKKQKEALAENTAEGKKRAQQLQKEIDLKNKLYRQEEKHVKGLDAAMQNLSEKTYKDLQQEVRVLNKLMRDGTVQKYSEEWQAMAERVKQCKREMKEYEQAVTDMPKKLSLWERGTNFLNKNWGALTQIIGAVTGLSMTIRKVTSDYAQMEQEMANVRKYTGQSMEEVERMNEDFKRMDTRTSREQLNQLAGAAGRLGIQSTEAVEEFVDAADKIGVALGDDLGDGAVDKIGKLAMAFGEDERMGLRGAMLATGSAVNELAQNSSAQAGYLVDFTARVAGFGKQLGLTQAQIMGFGAVMDENLLQDEMASTAFGNMLTKMQTDTAKFARIAGMDIKAFTDLLNKDANQAVLTLADSLKRADPQTMMKMLDDMGLDGSRAVAVLATLADKIDDVRDRQRIANGAYAEGTSVIKEFEIQNNTVQAGIDKAKKQFLDLSVELGKKLLPVVKYTISSTSLLIKGLNSLLDFVSKHKILIIALTAEIAILNAKRLYGIGLAKKEALWNGRVAESIKSIGTAIKANPWGIAITAVTAFVALLTEAAERGRKNTEVMTALGKAHQKAAEDYDSERAKIEMLNRQVHNNKLSYDQRKEALDALKEIVPCYLGDLDKEKGLINDNTDALTDYLTQLEKSIKMKAAKEELEEVYRKKRELERQQTNLNQDLNDANFSLAAANYSATTQANRLGTSGMRNLSKGTDLATKNAQARVNNVKEQLADVHNQLQQTETDIKDLNNEIISTSAELSQLKKGKATPDSNDADSGGGGGGGGNGGNAADDPLKKLEKDLKDALQRQQIEALLSYRQGEISYQQYMDRLDELQKQSFANRRKAYEDAHATEQQEYWQLLKEQSDYLDRQTEEGRKKRDSELQRDKALREANIRRQYNDIASEIYQDEEAMNEALFRNEREFLQKRIENARQGTQERMQLEQQLADLDEHHRLELAESYEKELKQMRNSYSRLSAQEQMETELAGLKLLYESKMNQGRISEEQYQQMIQQIREKYAKNIKDEQDERIHKGDKQQSKGTSIADGVFNLFTISDNYKQEMEAIDQMLADHTITEEEAAEKRRKIWQDALGDIGDAARITFEGIGKIVSAASSYAQACSDVEVARITANYDKQIEAAGKNSKKRERLEKQKDEAIAKAKTKANKKAMAMEMAQAIAQTAMGAISAYSSTMAGAPYPANLVLAPISAGIALAAGALQIATIKKQHEAEAAGYYEGGFTGGTQYRKEAGVVHEGEFVANHQAVNNRQLMPVFSLLDQAQRNNRVASLRAEDVTNVMGAGGSTQIVTPIVNVQTDNEELRSELARMRDINDMLLLQLQQPIDARVVLTGPDGLNEQQKRLNRMLRNK